MAGTPAQVQAEKKGFSPGHGGWTKEETSGENRSRHEYLAEGLQLLQTLPGPAGRMQRRFSTPQELLQISGWSPALSPTQGTTRQPLSFLIYIVSTRQGQHSCDSDRGEVSRSPGSTEDFPGACWLHRTEHGPLHTGHPQPHSTQDGGPGLDPTEPAPRPCHLLTHGKGS